MNKLIKNCFLLLLVTLPFSGSAQFGLKIPGFFQRYELGYSFVMANASYEGKSRIYTPGANIDIDTTYKIDMNSKGGFGASMGSYIPLAKLGRKSILALDISYLYTLMAWESKVPSYASGDVFADFDYSGATLSMALPVGIDFKFGCDAMTNKRIRFCTSIGAGVFPSYSLTTLDYDLDIDPGIGVTPYVKYEVGVFGGICAKVRLMASFGDTPYMDISNKYSDEFTQTESSTKLIGKSNISVSIILMPFSWAWKRTEWWNSY